MITKSIDARRDGKSSAIDALKYGAGLKHDRETGQLLDKSHRTRLGNFGLVDDGVYIDIDIPQLSEMMELAAIEMQANCDLNTRVQNSKKMEHFIVSFGQHKPDDSLLRDTEDSMLSALGLSNNHFATFLHNDNGQWHLHTFVSRIDKVRHNCGQLYFDQIKRDRVCREIELRHGLERDNGLHRIDENNQIVEVPKDERKKTRDQKKAISDKAQSKEKYSGEKSFQTWCNEIRIGDRLKHAKSWNEFHAAAAAYSCEVKPRGAGFIICPIGEKGGIQLSKVGLKNLPAKFGAFVAAEQAVNVEPVQQYVPAPTLPSGKAQYAEFQEAKAAFKVEKTRQQNGLREIHIKTRADLRAQFKRDLAEIRATSTGEVRFSRTSVAKMEQAAELAALTAKCAGERAALLKQLRMLAPGNTFREYLVKRAGQGDDAALATAQQYGAKDATDTSVLRELDQLTIVATASGLQNNPSPRIRFKHRVLFSGSVEYDLGAGRTVTDSRNSRQVQLNALAANSPESIEIALRFAQSKFGPRLTLTGSAEFQKLAVETAVARGLHVTFIDPSLDAYREKLVAERSARFARTTSQLSHSNQEKQYGPRSRKESGYSKQPARPIPPPHRRDRLHYLSESNLVLDTNTDVGVLRQNVPDSLGQRQAGGNHRVQRSAGGLGSGSSERVAGLSTAIPSELLSQPEAIDRDHVARSLAKMVDWIKKQGGKLKDIPRNVPCSGPIKLADELHAIQATGRGEYTVHRQTDFLEPLVAATQSVVVSYKGSRGSAKVKVVSNKLER